MPADKNFPPQIETIRRDGRKKIDERFIRRQKISRRRLKHFGATVAKKLTDACPPTKFLSPQTLNISPRRAQKNRRTLYPPTKNFPPQIETIRRDGCKKIDGRLPADKNFPPQIETIRRDGCKKIDGRLPADKIFIAAD